MLQCSFSKQGLSSLQATEKDRPAELYFLKKDKYKSAWVVEDEKLKHNCRSGCDVYCFDWTSQGLFSNSVDQILCRNPYSRNTPDEVSTGFNCKAQLSFVNNVK